MKLLAFEYGVYKCRLTLALTSAAPQMQAVDSSKCTALSYFDQRRIIATYLLFSSNSAI